VVLKKFISVLKKADLLLIAVLILVSISLTIFFYKNKNTQKAQIYHKGNLIGTYKLDQPEIIEIDKGIIVEIKDGKARLKKDTSPLQIGVKQSWSNTYPIISVPSELIIKFNNKKSEDMLITY